MLSGQQIILDLYNCHYDKLCALPELEKFVKERMEQFSLIPVSACTQKYENSANLSLAIFYDNGHVIVHTYPDTGFASVDALSTVSNIALEKTVMKIRQFLGAEKTKTTYIKRGDFGRLPDMKPTIHKNVKAWRRVRNTSAKVLKLLVTKKNDSAD